MRTVEIDPQTGRPRDRNSERRDDRRPEVRLGSLDLDETPSVRRLCELARPHGGVLLAQCLELARLTDRLNRSIAEGYDPGGGSNPAEIIHGLPQAHALRCGADGAAARVCRIIATQAAGWRQAAEQCVAQIIKDLDRREA